MRWSIIRLIWLRELRDQLRDRRTLFMVLVLPLLLYPVLGFAVLKFALGFWRERARSCHWHRAWHPGRLQEFPPRVPAGTGLSFAPQVAWLSATSANNVGGRGRLRRHGGTPGA